MAANRQPRPVATPANRTLSTEAASAFPIDPASEGQGALTCCAWCGRPMRDRSTVRGGRRRRFCSGSCRTLAHRGKARQIAGVAAVVFACPLDDAERMLDQNGMAHVSALLSAAGVAFDPSCRRFTDRTGRQIAPADSQTSRVHSGIPAAY